MLPWPLPQLSNSSSSFSGCLQRGRWGWSRPQIGGLQKISPQTIVYPILVNVSDVFKALLFISPAMGMMIPNWACRCSGKCSSTSQPCTDLAGEFHWVGWLCQVMSLTLFICHVYSCLFVVPGELTIWKESSGDKLVWKTPVILECFWGFAPSVQDNNEARVHNLSDPTKGLCVPTDVTVNQTWLKGQGFDLIDQQHFRRPGVPMWVQTTCSQTLSCWYLLMLFFKSFICFWLRLDICNLQSKSSEALDVLMEAIEKSGHAGKVKLQWSIGNIGMSDWNGWDVSR